MKFAAIALGVALSTSVVTASQAQTLVQEFTTEQKAVVDRELVIAQNTLDMRLKDYPSARFREVVAEYGTLEAVPFAAFCGYINAKDGRGAYTGWRFFVTFGSTLQFYEPENYDIAAWRKRGCTDGTLSSNTVSDPSDWSARIAYREQE